MNDGYIDLINDRIVLKPRRAVRYAVIDRMGADPRKIVSRHATHAAAERAAKRRGCGDRFAIVEDK